MSLFFFLTKRRNDGDGCARVQSFFKFVYKAGRRKLGFIRYYPRKQILVILCSIYRDGDRICYANAYTVVYLRWQLTETPDSSGKNMASKRARNGWSKKADGDDQQRADELLTRLWTVNNVSRPSRPQIESAQPAPRAETTRLYEIFPPRLTLRVTS